ncbi:MAG: ribonuclease HI family protein [Planctomycetes bacterium]|nr:ribonuclease HI family protein [Planctomycetota bacterium]
MQLIIRTDGGSRGNPGPAAIGIVIENQTGCSLFEAGYFIGDTTNNVAEYRAILKGLEEAQRLKGSILTIYCDSQLVVRQLIGQYRVKNPAMKTFHQQAMAQLKHFKSVTFHHVSREENEAADALVNRALNLRTDVIELNTAG